MAKDTRVSRPKYRPRKPDPLMLRAQRILSGTARFDDRYMPDHAELVKLVDILRSMGCVIVLVMGTWDIKHLGHEDYIQLGKDKSAQKYPKAEHVVTVVGVDSDKVTRARKGLNRPFVPEVERAKQIAHTRSVDIVTLEYKLRALPRLLPHDVRVISESTKDEKKLKAQGKFCAHLVNLRQQLNDSSSARLSRLTLEGKVEAAQIVETAMAKVLREIRNGK